MNTIKKEFDFGTLYIENTIAIGVMNEGITLNLSLFVQVSDYLLSHFKDQAYGYISNREFSYAIDPTVYMYASQKESLKAIAVVSENEITKSNVLLEKQFFKQPFEGFETLGEAKEWLKTCLISLV